MLDLMKMLPEEDYKIFKKYANAHLDGDTITSNYLELAWAEQKSTLAKLLGNALIYKVPVTFNVNHEMLSENFQSNFSNNEDIVDMVEDIKTILKYALFQKHISDFDLWNLSYSARYNDPEFYERYLFYDKVANQALYLNGFTFQENKVFLGEPFVSCTIPNTNIKIKITKGEKPFKCLKRIIRQCYPYVDKTKVNIDIDALLINLEKARIIQSQLLNNKTLSGNLVLSIHPMDFATMSDNASGWGSCMSWTGEGCYRLGTLEMLSSPMVVVAYLESDNRLFYDEDSGIEWNNKKWRELFVVNEQVIVNVKGYPYQHEELEKKCIHILKELAETNLNYNYTNTFYTAQCTSNLRPLGEMYGRINLRTNIMYNDFGSSYSYYYISPATEEAIYNKECVVIQYGDTVRCLSCGDIISITEDKDYIGNGLACPNCRGLYQCDYCGGFHEREDMSNIDGELVCDYCLNEYFVECKICGDLMHIDDALILNTVYVDRWGDFHSQEYYIHKHCLEEYDYKSWTFNYIAFPHHHNTANQEINEENKCNNITVPWWRAGTTLSNVVDPMSINLLDCDIIEMFDSYYLNNSQELKFPKEWIHFHHE